MDLIDRQAAIDAIKTWGLIDGLSEGQAIEILADEEKLPSAQRWIPVTERLPENNEIALVCGAKGGVRVARVYLPAANGIWKGDPKTNWWTIVGTGKSFYPVAWMPLPEPYKGE